MPLVVQKFGGSSVATAERIMAAARRAIRARQAGSQVIMVVSARGDTTDELISLAREISEQAPAREMDMLLATGFQLRWQSYAFNEEEGRRKAASKTKYTCPDCEQNAWARPSANLVCGDCEVQMEEQ